MSQPTVADFAPYRAELLLVAQRLHCERAVSARQDLLPEALLEHTLTRLATPGAAVPAPSESLPVWMAGHLRRDIVDAWEDATSYYHDLLTFQARIRWARWSLPPGRVGLEDIVNGAWAKVLAAREQTRALPEEQYLPFVYRVLENHAIDVRRHHTPKAAPWWRENSLDQEVNDSSDRIGRLLADQHQGTPSEPLRREEMCARVRVEIERLRPVPLRDVMVYKLQDLSVEEIQQRMGTTRARVYRWTAQAFAILRERLERLWEGRR